MKRSAFGSLAMRLYRTPVVGQLLLRLTVRREGGDMYSLTLRSILEKYHGVTAGPYSYGSLLIPGMADRGTVIGAYVSVGPSVRRFAANHPIDRPFLNAFTYNPSLGVVSQSDDVERTRCTIGDDAWIGANVVITSRCSRIGTGAVIGAGAVVTSDVEDFAIVVGTPARTVAHRLTPELRGKILALDVANMDPTALVAWSKGEMSGPDGERD